MDQEPSLESALSSLEFPKKQARKPRFVRKFDADLLLQENGLPLLNKSARSLKFTSNNKQNLSSLLDFYQVWFHGIDSSLSMQAAIDKTEKIARERRCKVFLETCLIDERRKDTMLDNVLTREEDDVVMDGQDVQENIQDGLEDTVDDLKDLENDKVLNDKQRENRLQKEKALELLALKRRKMLDAFDDDGDDQDDEMNDAPMFL